MWLGIVKFSTDLELLDPHLKWGEFLIIFKEWDAEWGKNNPQILK